MVSRLRQLLSTARLCRQARVNAMLLQASTMTLTRGSVRLAIAASIALARCAQVCSLANVMRRTFRLPSASRRTSPTRARKDREEHTSELQSLMRISYAVFCLKKKNEVQLICE